MHRASPRPTASPARRSAVRALRGADRARLHVESALGRAWNLRSRGIRTYWPKILQWLETEPGITAKKLHERLVAMAPTMYFRRPVAHPPAPHKSLAIESRKGAGNPNTRGRRRGEVCRRESYRVPRPIPETNKSTLGKEVRTRILDSRSSPESGAFPLAPLRRKHGSFTAKSNTKSAYRQQYARTSRRR